MNVELLDSFDAVGQEAWDALVAKSPTDTIFQTWAWQKAWWRAHAGHARALRLVAVYEQGDLRALMPLFLEKGVLRFIGHGASDAIDLIYDAGRSADLLMLLGPLMACQDWDQIDLTGIPEASPTWRYLKVIAQEAGAFPVSMSKHPVRGLRLEGREDRVRRFLQAGPVVRQAGILAAQGKVTAVHHAAPGMVAPRWNEFFIQHVHRWVLREEPSCFVARSRRDLCRYATEDPVLNEALVFSELHLNGRAVGFHMGLVYQGVFYAMASSFDIALKRFSPDEVIWGQIVAYALDRGCRAVIFVSPEEASVRRFADRMGVLRSVRIFRSRRRQLAAKLMRWVGRLPLAMGAYDLLIESWRTLVVLFRRHRIVRARRQAAGSKGSFEDMHADHARVSPDRHRITRPEIELLRRLRPEWKDIRLLDMGVGAGRTGMYFAPAVKLYHAFDRCAPMVAAARAYLDDQLEPSQIFEAEAGAMVFAPDGAYDLVLFGGEGIDEASEIERARILKEVRRVGREGAWFFFSSRNLQSFRSDAGYRGVGLLRHWQRRMLMAAANTGLARACRQPSVALLDETGDYRLPVVYVTPGEQVRLLKEAGFHDIRVFSTRSGLEVRDWRRWVKLTDEVLYYLCRV